MLARNLIAIDFAAWIIIKINKNYADVFPVNALDTTSNWNVAKIQM